MTRTPPTPRQAFQDFKTLLQNYPNSSYAAEHDRPEEAPMTWGCTVKRDAPDRRRQPRRLIVETYPDTVETEKALEIMVNAYDTP